MVTVVTKTIGATGRDYATFTLAEAAVESIATAEFGGTDLVANDGAIVFEADAGTYDGLIFSYSLTTDPTRNVTFRPAAGSEHGGVRGAGVVVQDNVAVTSYNFQAGIGAASTSHNLVLEGLEAHVRSGVASRCTHVRYSRGVIFRNLLLNNEGTATTNLLGSQGWGTAAEPIVYENCVIHSSGARGIDLENNSGSASYVEIVNCTKVDTTDPFVFTGGSGAIDLLLLNNLSLSSAAYSNGGTGARNITGSNNFGGATKPFPAAIQGSPYPITATTSFSTPLGSGDYAVYMGATGALANVTGNDVWQQGVGPGANSDVPTTDINGVARSGASCNPGAFEADGFVAPTVLTRTIGSGKDYASFTLAEAAVTSIGSGTDLTFENEAIVFEADAGNYSESLNFDTSGGLTCDATRNVTWTHATGAGHGGQFESGANLVGGCTIREDHAVVDGLSVSPSSGGAAGIFSAPEGVFLRNMMVYSTNSYAIRLDQGATAAFPGVVENCVCKSDSLRPFDIRSEGSGIDAHWRVVNTTVFTAGTNVAFQVGSSSSDTLNLELTNVLVLGPRAFFDFGGATLVLTGSNNFGPATNPFPAALQGSPYPITAVTDPEQPAAGDYAIHDAQGRLYDTSRNDVLQTGVGPSANSDVPTTDITGEARSGATCNPGAFEATVVLSISTPAAGALNNSPDFRVHLDRRVTDASFGVSAVYDSASDSTTFTLPYRLNTYARMQVVTRKTSGANAGELLSVTATDANAGTVTVAGNHTSTAVFIGETYIMKYEFSTPHLQAQQRMSPTKGASHRIRYGTVTFADTSFFEVKVKPKGGDAYTYTFNGNLLNEPETLLGQVAVYDGDFKFPVMADHDRATVTLENDSPLPSRFLGCEWEAFYHSRIGQRSRF